MTNRSATPQRLKRSMAVILAGLVLYVGAFTAVVPWRSHAQDEVAVVVAAPVICVIAAVTILAYALDTLLVAIAMRVRRTKRSYRVQVTAFWEGVLFALPLATLSLAFLLMTGLFVSTGIKWALPGMKLMIIGDSICTGFLFVYGWIRGILRGASQQGVSGMVFQTYSVVVNLLQSVGVGREAARVIGTL